MKHLFDKQNKYSIRKFTIGVCSAVIGLSILNAGTAYANTEGGINSPQVGQSDGTTGTGSSVDQNPPAGSVRSANDATPPALAPLPETPAQTEEKNLAQGVTGEVQAPPGLRATASDSNISYLTDGSESTLWKTDWNRNKDMMFPTTVSVPVGVDAHVDSVEVVFEKANAPFKFSVTVTDAQNAEREIHTEYKDYTGRLPISRVTANVPEEFKESVRKVHVKFLDRNPATGDYSVPSPALSEVRVTGFEHLANYDAVRRAIESAPHDLSSYTEDSVRRLEQARNAVELNKKRSEQSVVNGYADAINLAIRSLTPKQPPVTYTRLTEDATTNKAQLDLLSDVNSDVNKRKISEKLQFAVGKTGVVTKVAPATPAIGTTDTPGGDKTVLATVKYSDLPINTTAKGTTTNTGWAFNDEANVLTDAKETAWASAWNTSATANTGDNRQYMTLTFDAPTVIDKVRYQPHFDKGEHGKIIKGKIEYLTENDTWETLDLVSVTPKPTKTSPIEINQDDNTFFVRQHNATGYHELVTFEVAPTRTSKIRLSGLETYSQVTDLRNKMVSVATFYALGTHTETIEVPVEVVDNRENADYTAVDAAIRTKPENTSIYTEDSVRAVDTAISAVVRDKKIDEQTTVDGYATAISNAIRDLVKKPADYTAVDTAIRTKPENTSIYTEDSVRAVDTAISAVVRDKKIDEQTTVDGYATAIRNAIRDLVKKPADYTAVDAAIRTKPEDTSIYTEDSVRAVDTAISAVVRDKKIDEQTTVDGYATAIRNAIRDLVKKPADYTAVDAAIRTKPEDTSIYTEDSVRAVDTAISAVVRDKKIDEQTTVDGYATAIRNAIRDLVKKPADYTAVDAAIRTKPEDTSIYTEDSVRAVDTAISAVVRDKKIDEQTTVDGYATAISNAIRDLVKKPADYTAVDAAIRTKPEDTSIYTEDSVRAVDTAISAVVRDKKIDEQTTVDGYATAISNAIRDLVKKPADYTAVDAAIRTKPEDTSIYTEDSVRAVDTAISAVVRDKKIDEQTTVDGYATAIRNAIRDLVKKPADYTAVDAAIRTKPEDTSIYTEDSVNELTSAIEAVVRDKKIDEQEVVNSYAERINAAVEGLQLKTVTAEPGANYDAVARAIDSVPEDLTIYTVDTVRTLNNAIKAVEFGKKVAEQSAVDDYATAITTAIDGLVKRPADYTLVDAAIATKPENTAIYTDETLAAVTDAIAAVVRDKKIDEQATVTGYASAIVEAIKRLEKKPASYAGVDQAIEAKPENLTELYTPETVEAVESAISAVVRDKKIDEQATVDAYASAITKAIGKLVKKAANYEAVDRAIADGKVAHPDLSLYTDDTAEKVTEALAAVVRDKKIDEQSAVDAYATAITEAYAGLILKPVKDEDKYQPKAETVVWMVGKELTVDDVTAAVTVPAEAGQVTKAVEGDLPTTAVVGDHQVTVTVTYGDNTVDRVTVPVVVLNSQSYEELIAYIKKQQETLDRLIEETKELEAAKQTAEEAKKAAEKAENEATDAKKVAEAEKTAAQKAKEQAEADRLAKEKAERDQKTAELEAEQAKKVAKTEVEIIRKQAESDVRIAEEQANNAVKLAEEKAAQAVKLAEEKAAQAVKLAEEKATQAVKLAEDEAKTAIEAAEKAQKAVQTAEAKVTELQGEVTKAKEQAEEANQLLNQAILGHQNLMLLLANAETVKQAALTDLEEAKQAQKEAARKVTEAETARRTAEDELAKANRDNLDAVATAKRAQEDAEAELTRAKAELKEATDAKAEADLRAVEAVKEADKLKVQVRTLETEKELATARATAAEAAKETADELLKSAQEIAKAAEAEMNKALAAKVAAELEKDKGVAAAELAKERAVAAAELAKEEAIARANREKADAISTAEREKDEAIARAEREKADAIAAANRAKVAAEAAKATAEANAAAAEQETALARADLAKAEAAKAAAETKLIAAEVAKAEAERAKVEAVTAANADKSAAEAAKLIAEANAVEAERAKAVALNELAQAHTAKVAAETRLAEAEAAKSRAEREKADAIAAAERAKEDAIAVANREKAAAETAKVIAEAQATAAEQAKAAAQAELAQAQAARAAAESRVIAAEIARADAERAKEDAIATAIAANSDKAAAEAARLLAEANAAEAERAKLAALNELVAAETAQTAAATRLAAAEAAKLTAEREKEEALAAAERAQALADLAQAEVERLKADLESKLAEALSIANHEKEVAKVAAEAAILEAATAQAERDRALLEKDEALQAAAHRLAEAEAARKAAEAKLAEQAQATATEQPSDGSATQISPSPARTFRDSATGVIVSLAAGEDSRIVDVKILHKETNDAATPSVLAGKDYDLFDIELVDQNGQIVKTQYAAEVILPVDSGKEVAEVIYLPNSDLATVLPFRTTVLENGQIAVVFTAPHFSEYGIVYKSAASVVTTGEVSQGTPTPVSTVIGESTSTSISTVTGEETSQPITTETSSQADKPASEAVVVARLTPKAPAAAAPVAASPTVATPSAASAPAQASLPETGDEDSMAFSLGMAGLMSALGLMGVKSRKED